MKILHYAEEITPEIERDIEDCLNWFESESRLSTEGFIDRLCTTYGLGSSPPWELDSYDNEAARKIMRIARQLRKDREIWG